jgi:hypothetical protein
MPGRRWRPKCGRVFALTAVVLFVSATAEAQTARSSVTLTGRVSETVALSIPPVFNQDKKLVNAVSSSVNTVRITVSGDDAQPSVIRVPLLVRSNTAFNVSATFDSDLAELKQLSVVDVHATGTSASPQSVNALKVKPFSNIVTSQPMLVLSGPRVSYGGTLESANNALHVTLLIHLNPHAPRAWQIHLTLVGTAARLTQ